MFHQAKVWRLRKLGDEFWLSGKSENGPIALEFGAGFLNKNTIRLNKI